MYEPDWVEERVGDGDLDALSMIIREHYGLYIHLAASSMPKNDPDSIDDLVQEGIQKIIKEVDKYDCERGPFAYWSCMVFRKGMREYMTHRHMTVKGCNENHKLTYSEKITELDYVEFDFDNDIREMVTEEVKRLLKIVKRKLPAAHEVVVRKMNGESFRGMAKNGLGIPRARASELYSQALEIMRSATNLDSGYIIDRQ